MNVRARWSALRPTIRPRLRRLLPWLAPALAGMLLFAAFGTVPARLERPEVVSPPWAVPAMPDRTAAAAAADAVWQSRFPWGGAPPPVEAAPVPTAVPVAIVSTAAGHTAVFVMTGIPEVHVRAGDPLPDGGRVEEIQALSVAWIDGQGQRQQRIMLSDPPRSPRP